MNTHLALALLALGHVGRAPATVAQGRASHAQGDLRGAAERPQPPKQDVAVTISALAEDFARSRDRR